MAMLDSTVSALRRPYSELEIDEAQLAAVGFLARYGGRTLDAYRHDLRAFFHWPTPACRCWKRLARTSSSTARR